MDPYWESFVAIPVVVDLLLRPYWEFFEEYKDTVAIPVVVDLLLRLRLGAIWGTRWESQSLL